MLTLSMLTTDQTPFQELDMGLNESFSQPSEGLFSQYYKWQKYPSTERGKDCHRLSLSLQVQRVLSSGCTNGDAFVSKQQTAPIKVAQNMEEHWCTCQIKLIRKY